MIFDTGSGHVIVPSTACASTACAVHKTYDQKASLHAVDVNADGSEVTPGKARDQVNVAFGTGEVTGVFVDDRFCLGPQSGNGTTADEINCVDLRLLTATEMSHDPFHEFAFDGVVGLGMDVLAMSPEMSFFGMMAKQKKLARPLFGLFLADCDDETSEISFGGHSPELVRAAPEWAPVVMPEEGHWMVSIKRVRLNGEIFDFCEDGQCRAVVDSGTSVLAVPKALAPSLQDALERPLRSPASPPEAGLDCRLTQGATLYFEVQGLTQPIALGPGDYTRESAKADAAAHCRPTLLPFDVEAPLGPKLFIWGEPVLRKYYTTYDWQAKRVGFALAAHSKTEIPSVMV
jgi:hypothetical protein